MKSPYFYIIKHKESGKKYAGAKWAKDANPDNFMTEDGYQTSSKFVKRIIKEEGLASFYIEEIIKLEELQIPFGCQTIDEYETWFLESNFCNSSSSWLNLHRSDKLKSHGDKEMRSIMMKKYGYEYASQVPEIKEKVKNTCFEKYGYEYVSQIPEIKEMVKKSRKATCLEKYGTEYYFNITKAIETFNIKYGGNAPACSKEIVEKTKMTCEAIYGGPSSMCSAEVKEKRKETWTKKYGGHPMTTGESLIARERNSYKKYGYPSPEKIAWICEHCDKHGTNLSNYKAHHHNKCKSNTLKIISDTLVGLILFPKDPSNPFAGA